MPHPLRHIHNYWRTHWLHGFTADIYRPREDDVRRPRLGVRDSENPPELSIASEGEWGPRHDQP